MKSSTHMTDALQHDSSAKRRTVVVSLLICVVIISSLDKTIFAFSGSQLMRDLSLSPEQFGLAASAFFFLYAISGILVGFLANVMQARWILVCMSLIWATSQFMVTAASSFGTLVASRLVLGIGVGPGTPVVLHACFKWYKPTERVFPAALVQAALMLGALLSGIAFPFLLSHFGWRQVYFGLGIISVLWIALWLAFGGEGSEDARAEPSVNVRYRELLWNRTFVCVTCVGLVSFIPSALALSWTPLYLQNGLGLTPAMVGAYFAVATICLIAANLVIAPLPKHFLGKGRSFKLSMVAPPMLACALGGLTFLLFGVLSHSIWLMLGLLLLGSVFVGLVPMFANAIIAHISPSDQRGASLAIYNSVVTGAGVLVPYFMGWLITRMNGDIAGGFKFFLGGAGVLTAAIAGIGFMLISPEHVMKSRLSGQLATSNQGAESV